jgi:3-hydroxy acid dehydrogenase/malonic semialdehyde reductase
MNQLAFITGATSGIGYATAKKLASMGYRLFLTARNEKKLQEVKSEFEMKFNSSVEISPLDVRNPDEIHAVVKQAISSMGVPDVLVNNAGLARGLEPYGETKEEDILQMLDTNIKGLFLVTHEILPYMVKRNTGHIVNLGSTAGLYAYKGAAVYCATKAAVKTFSDGIRIDVIDTDIKVTTIQPGIVHTPFSEVRFHGDKKRADAVYEGVEALLAEDIADAISYVLTRPRRMQVSDMVIMANQQATGFMVSKTPVRKG